MEWIILLFIGFCIWLNTKTMKLPPNFKVGDQEWWRSEHNKWKASPPKEKKEREDFFMRE
jgi:hypothetical protein